MKIHILIPYNIYKKITKNDLSCFSDYLISKIKNDFGDIELNIVVSSDVKSFEFYAMEKHKSQRSESDLIIYIIKLFEEKFGDMIESAPKVMLNYSKFNSNFNPESNISFDDCSIKKPTKSEEFDYEKLSYNYSASIPFFTFDQVVLSKETLNKILESISILEVETKVFDEWGLRSIIPSANSSLNFYGPPGTGKSMAAEAIASKLGKRIIRVTYADIESKYHGEGPKMVKAIFMAAEREDAILFIDESDSLLSKRLTTVSQGSEQAINSLRSQLLISLENHKGIVIFATNLVVNYDKAFISRLINVEFNIPNSEEREKIWNNHLRGKNINIPLADDVNLKILSEKYEFVGREIRNAVKDSCINAALKKQKYVMQQNLLDSCDKILKEKNKMNNVDDYTLSSTTNNELKKVINEKNKMK